MKSRKCGNAERGTGNADRSALGRSSACELQAERVQELAPRRCGTGQLRDQAFTLAGPDQVLRGGPHHHVRHPSLAGDLDHLHVARSDHQVHPAIVVVELVVEPVIGAV